jgi:hypothetical protein
MLPYCSCLPVLFCATSYPRRANLIEANLLFQNPSRLSFTADAISSDNPDVLAAPVTCDRDLGSYLIHDGSNPWDCSNEKWNWDTIRMINSTTPATTPRYIRCFMDKWSQVIPETCRLHIEDTPKKNDPARTHHNSRAWRRARSGRRSSQKGSGFFCDGGCYRRCLNHLGRGCLGIRGCAIPLLPPVDPSGIPCVVGIMDPRSTRTRLREFSRRVASEFGRTFCDEKATPSPVSEKLLVWDGNSKSIVEVSIDKISVDTICKALDNDGDRFRAVTSHEGNVIVQPLNLDDPDPIQDVCLYSRRKLQEILTARVVMDFQRP